MKTEILARSTGLLVLRLGAGVYMMTHGWGKLQMLVNGQAENFVDPIGIGAAASLFLITLAEFFCPIFIVLGLGTRLASIPLVIGMIVAAFVVHGADPWTMGKAGELFRAGEADSWGSKEAALIYLVPFLALTFTGPGSFSLDAIIASRWRKRTAGTAGAA